MLILTGKAIYLIFITAITIIHLRSKLTEPGKVRFLRWTFDNSTLPLLLIITVMFPALGGMILIARGGEFVPFLLAPYGIVVIGGLVEIAMGFRRHGLDWILKDDQELESSTQPRE